MTRVVIPFKDKDSANFVKIQLKDLSLKLQTTVQPVFVSRKIGQDHSWLINSALSTNFNITCAMQVAVGYTCVHLHTPIDGHNNASSSVRKHYDQDHSGAVPEDLLSCFRVLKKCMNKLDCAVNEMLHIKPLRPRLNLQTDSIRARVFV